MNGWIVLAGSLVGYLVCYRVVYRLFADDEVMGGDNEAAMDTAIVTQSSRPAP